MMFDITLSFGMHSLINSIQTNRKVEFQYLCDTLEAFEVTKLLKTLVFLFLAGTFSLYIVFALL